MAEFSELVRIKKRICGKYKCNIDCSGCPIEENGLCGVISISSYVDSEFKELEEKLLAWAAEHPEPVYPTWLEYLCEIGVIPKVIHCNELYLTAYNGIHDNRIPADIAEKLGIEPKEDA